jgi:uncharacterized coiled-coil protein SlyX
MADSKALMARLARVERDSAEFKKMLGQIANILSDQNERIDRVGERVDLLGERLGERLDRLIAVTIQERTSSIERLTDIERRLSRLEERSGF